MPQEKEMLIVYAKGAKGYESLLKLSTLYQQGLTWTSEMTEWIVAHNEDVKIVLPPMDSEWVAAHSKGKLGISSSCCEGRSFLALRLP